MKKFLTTLMILVSSVAMAQECGFDDYNDLMLARDTNYANFIQKANARWAQKVAAMANSRYVYNGYGTEYEIPVVVHVIHTGGSVGTIYNPSDATIEGAIDDMNEILEASHSSYVDTNNGGVRLPIKFVLAKRTSGCASTNGIVRSNGTSLSGGYSANGVKRSGASGVADETLKASSRWDSREYYNIWVVNKIDGNDGTSGSFVAGYAQFPGGTDTTDGTVILATQMTSGKTTLVHEIGHAFFLYHTFQGDGTGSTCPTNTSCSTQGDLVCDTDPHRRNSSTCPSNASTNICTGLPWSNTYSHKNFMDYSSCPDRFTAGQRTRFMDALETYRPGLATSMGAIAPHGTSMTAASCTTTINAANASNTFNMGPTKVVMNDLNSNSRGYNLDHFVNYIDRSCTQWGHLTQGKSYTLSVSTETNRQRVQAFIDYNDNGTFVSGERIMNDLGTCSPCTTVAEVHTNTVAIPTSGVTTCKPLRMRVVSEWSGATIVSNGCGTMTYGQSEDFTIYVKKEDDTVTMFNTITAGSNPTCTTGSVTFSATASKSLSGVSYQWYRNSQPVGTASTYTASSLAAGTYYVWCKVKYTNGCSVTDSMFTNAIALSVGGSTVTPSVSISSTDTTICSGTSVTFTPTPTNGGTSPTYQWKVNGSNVATGATYTTSSLTNGQTVTCVMTSNEPCASPTTATSNGITMTVTPSVTPSVSISSGSGTTVCSGASVTFTAVPTNGGTTPSYQWKVNGSNVGTNSNMYTTSSLSNGDAVTCVMTSNDPMCEPDNCYK